MQRISRFLIVLIMAGCGGDEDTNVVPCEGPNGPCIVIEPGPSREAALTALIEAQPGDIILFKAGVHELDGDLSLDVDGVTLRGEGKDQTVLSFSGQTQGAQGVLITANDVIVQDLGIEDTVGDGVKFEGATGVTVQRVRVEWTGGPNPDNGAYGIYPVQCTNVLIEDSLVIGASDAGIYVGQSETIIVRRNEARKNVAGIEIENSSDADVHDNLATENTGGLLIFNLPGLQVAGGARTRAFNNTVIGNNTDNFAPEGNIVGLVPRGTGMVILAGHEIEIFENEIGENLTTNLAIISYLLTQEPYDDPDYDPYPDTIFIHDNVFGSGGEDATGSVMGALMIAALSTVMNPVEVPSIVFDGFVNPDKALAEDPRRLQPAYNLCFRENTGADFANLDMPNASAMVSLDATVHDCEHAALPPVVIEGAGQ